MSLTVLVVLAGAIAAVTSLTINTPTSVQACIPSLLTWGNGVPPYYVSIIPGKQPGAVALKDFPQTNDTSVKWIVDQPAGTQLSLAIKDGTGEQNYSEEFTVQSSSVTCNTATGNSTPGTTPTKGGAASPTATSTAGHSTTSNSNSSSPTTNPSGGSSNTSTTASNQARTSAATRNIPKLLALGSAVALAAFV